MPIYKEGGDTDLDSRDLFFAFKTFFMIKMKSQLNWETDAPKSASFSEALLSN